MRTNNPYTWSLQRIPQTLIFTLGPLYYSSSSMFDCLSSSTLSSGSHDLSSPWSFLLERLFTRLFYWCFSFPTFQIVFFPSISFSLLTSSYICYIIFLILFSCLCSQSGSCFSFSFLTRHLWSFFWVLCPGVHLTHSLWVILPSGLPWFFMFLVSLNWDLCI